MKICFPTRFSNLSVSPFLPNTDSFSATKVVSNELEDLRLAVKDVFHMNGIATTAGNPDWQKTHAIPDATHSNVEKLLSAGAKFVGKTITDELAYSLNGQNIHFGTPTNYASPSRLPGGSSSGSAAAVAGGFADIGLGTDTGGSIRVPASYNGLFGLRPTHGVIASDNMVHLADSFDTVGWLTNDLATLKKVAEILFANKSYKSAFPSTDSIKLGILKPTLKIAEHQEQIENWLAGLSQSTVEIEDIDPIELELAEAFRILQGAEIIQEHREWLNTVKPRFAEDIAARFQQSALITEQDVARAATIRDGLCHKLNAVFSQCDVIAIPTTPGIAPLLDATPESLGDYRKQLLSLTAIAGLAGLPQLHLPLFSFQDAPCGVSLIGRKGEDFALISRAEQLIGKSK